MGDGPKGGYYRDDDGKGFHDAWGNKIGSPENKAAAAGEPAEPKAKKSKRAKKSK